MKLSTFLGVKAFISIVFGIGFVLIPAALMSWYGVTLDAAGIVMARYFGACFIGIGLICSSYKNSDYKALQGIIFSLFIADTIGFIVAIQGQLSGLVNALGWVNVVLWLLFALGLGYFRFVAKANSQTHSG